jgi:hypothetical protein
MAGGIFFRAVETQLGARRVSTVKVFPQTASSARKFVQNDQVELWPVKPPSNSPPIAKSNTEHMVTAGAGLKALSLAIDAVAKNTVAEVAAARSTISLLSPDFQTDLRTLRPEFTEQDVLENQKRQAELAKKIVYIQAPSQASSKLGWTPVAVAGAEAQKVQTPDVISNPSMLEPAITRDAALNYIRKQVESAIDTALTNSRTQFLPTRDEGKGLNIDNVAVPTLERVQIDMNKRRGGTDCFFATLTFNLPASQVESGGVSAIRIFRSTILSPNFSREPDALSVRGMDRIRAERNVSRRKNDDTQSVLERRLQDDNIPNDLTMRTPIDPALNRRVVASTSKMFISPELVGVDRSVAENQRFQDSIRLQDPNYQKFAPNPVLFVGQGQIWSDRMSATQRSMILASEPKTTGIVDKNNSLEFKEIAFISHDKLQSKKIADHYVYQWDDEEVSYGRQYKYFVVSVNKYMISSSRSKIVTVGIDGLRVPERPRNVDVDVTSLNVAFSITAEDQLIERFEIWKKSVIARPNSREFFIDTAENGFSYIDDVVNGDQKGGGTFTDSYVIPGSSYQYRIYSVDIFGNKSESPFQVDVYVPDTQQAMVQLMKPTITAEVDSTTHKVKITLSCEDPNVRTLHLERRDLTIHQGDFGTPGQITRQIMGTTSVVGFAQLFSERVEDNDPQRVWNGLFINGTPDISSPGDQINFTDFLVSFDRTYQYRVHGEDIYGNKTSYAMSQPVLVYRKLKIDSPVNVNPELITDESGNIMGVGVSWEPGANDISPEDKLGSQKKLLDSSVRTLYHVERKKIGEDRWAAFPMTEQYAIVDPLLGTMGQPKFQPSLCELNQMYEYRVTSVQSGGFVSNTTDPVGISVSYPLVSPMNVQLRTPDSAIRPFFVMINWDTSARSAVVDYWEIQRCEVNNFASARLNNKNPDDYLNLTYTPWRTVYREASRFRSYWTEQVYPTDVSQQNLIFTGEHHFMDTNVSFGNSYFYRIRAVDQHENVSSWTYKGIKITDASFEEKVNKTVTTEEKKRLSNTFRPGRYHFIDDEMEYYDSYGYQPQFSKPGRIPSLVSSRNLVRSNRPKPLSYRNSTVRFNLD